MVTIGFKELLEKLEEYFGKGVVKAFLALFALSALVWVAGLAVTQGEPFAVGQVDGGDRGKIAQLGDWYLVR